MSAICWVLFMLFFDCLVVWCACGCVVVCWRLGLSLFVWQCCCVAVCLLITWLLCLFCLFLCLLLLFWWFDVGGLIVFWCGFLWFWFWVGLCLFIVIRFVLSYVWLFGWFELFFAGVLVVNFVCFVFLFWFGVFCVVCCVCCYDCWFLMFVYLIVLCL